MALIECPECGKEVSDTAKKCPNCGYTLKKSIIANPKFKKTLLIVVCILAVIGASFFAIKLISPNLFRSVDDMLADGTYVDAYGKASSDEQKQDIMREDAIAFCAADAVGMLKDPTSFTLKSGAQVNAGNKSVLLEVIAKNSYGNNVVNYWYYDYDSTTQSYEYAASFSDFSDERYYDFDTIETRAQKATINRCKSLAQYYLYDGSYIFLSDEAVDRINTLFSNGKLKKIELIKTASAQ